MKRFLILALVGMPLLAQEKPRNPLKYPMTGDVFAVGKYRYQIGEAVEEVVCFTENTGLYLCYDRDRLVKALHKLHAKIVKNADKESTK